MEVALFLFLTLVVGSMQFATAYLGYSATLKSSSDEDRSRYEAAFLIIGGIGIFAAVGIAVLAVVGRFEPQWDYAYLKLDEAVPITDGLSVASKTTTA